MVAKANSKKVSVPVEVPQDLHIHSTFSSGDSSVDPGQSIELIARFRYATYQGIADHLDYLVDGQFPSYAAKVTAHGFYVGVEVGGGQWVGEAEQVDVEYYIYHCRDCAEDYRGVEHLLASGKPVIIAHPLHLETNLSKLPTECLIEINNRYVWRSDWRKGFARYTSRFDFVIGSDAHQPNWLNQTIARQVAYQLGVREKLIFAER